MAELNRYLSRATGRDRPVIEIPDAIGKLIARLGFLPGAPMTWDQWLMLQQDSVAERAGLRSLRHPPGPARRRRRGLADALPPPRPLREGIRFLRLSTPAR